MSIMDELLAANGRFAEGFTLGDVPIHPTKRVAIVTCMDARVHPERFLGLSIGDAHVIRNAGGRVSGAIRSLIISTHVLGTREFVVIHHTDCEMLSFSNADLHGKLADEHGVDATHIDFLPFSDEVEAVKEDVEAIKASPYLPDAPVSGYIYDVFSGRLEEVVEPAP